MFPDETWVCVRRESSARLLASSSWVSRRLPVFPGVLGLEYPWITSRRLKPHSFYGCRQPWRSPLVLRPCFWKQKPCCLKTALPVTGWESRAAPRGRGSVPPGLLSALHAWSLGLCPPGASGCAPWTPLHAPYPGTSPVPRSGCVLRSPACSPCRAGIAGVCSSMDETLGATGILGLRKRFTCLAPGSSPAPTRWVAPAPLLGSDMPSPQGCSSCAGLTLASAALPVLPDRPVREGEERLSHLQHRRPQVGGAGPAGGRGRVLTASALPESIPGCTFRPKTVCRISHSIAYSSRN